MSDFFYPAHWVSLDRGAVALGILDFFEAVPFILDPGESAYIGY